MILNKYPYIQFGERSGDLMADVRDMLEKNEKLHTFKHVKQVAAVCVELAEQFGLDCNSCFAGGLLHDISAVMRPADMLAYAEENSFDLCEAERRYPFLLHQRLSVKIAQEYFCVVDENVLSAIECHTTLKADPTKYDMVLFIADKLAWDQEGKPPFYDAVKEALQESLEKACWLYMKYMEDNGKLLCPHANWIAGYDWIKRL